MAAGAQYRPGYQWAATELGGMAVQSDGDAEFREYLEGLADLLAAGDDDRVLRDA